MMAIRQFCERKTSNEVGNTWGRSLEHSEFFQDVASSEFQILKTMRHKHPHFVGIVRIDVEDMRLAKEVGE
jgi:hypothetical protein